MHDWSALQDEFAIWRALGLTLPIWWRDDDAVRVTSALERLAALSARVGVDVHLAVIPDHLQSDLAPFVQAQGRLWAITHGWTHRDLSLPRKKSCEFGRHRPADEVRREVLAGARIIRRSFGTSARAVFAPPWNRFALDHAPVLAEAGYSTLSLFKPRIWKMGASGVELINTHIDPIAWRGTRALCPPEEIIAKTVKLMRDRRMGYTDPDEPLGYLAHHLDHTEAIWDFTEEFWDIMLSGPVSLAQLPHFPADMEISS
ncbi:MAG: polysaccharide deacetylase [Pseudomonadota bacterium]